MHTSLITCGALDWLRGKNVRTGGTSRYILYIYSLHHRDTFVMRGTYDVRVLYPLAAHQ